MNILTQKLPTEVTIDGAKFKINTDFRVWIEFERLMRSVGEGESEDLSQKPDAVVKIIKLCFGERGATLPPNLKSTLDALGDFYCCNQPTRTAKSKGKSKSKPKEVMSYDCDSEYVYAAFMRQYHIDLVDTPYLHWFKYSAMLKSLNDDEKLMKIISYRQADVSQIKDKHRKNAILQLKSLYALPQTDDGKSADDELNEAIAELM